MILLHREEGYQVSTSMVGMIICCLKDRGLLREPVRNRIPAYRQDIKRFVLPLRSPKLNGAVERAHQTHTEEFYEVTESSFDLSELKVELLEWEGAHNTVRPHQALDYLTPLKFLWQKECQERKMCH